MAMAVMSSHALVDAKAQLDNRSACDATAATIVGFIFWVLCIAAAALMSVACCKKSAVG